MALTAAFGPFGAAMGACEVALNLVTQAEQAHTKSVQDETDALNKIYTDAASGTTDSITKQIQQKQAELSSQTQGQGILEG